MSEKVSAPTPGPWKIGRNVSETEAVFGADGSIVAYPALSDINPYYKALDRKSANARLISKAWLLPELVEALQKAQVVLTQMDELTWDQGVALDAATDALKRYEESDR